MTLRAQLDHLRAEFEKTTAPEIRSVMHRATADLQQSGIMDRVLKAGDSAPVFSLAAPNGQLISSQTLLSQGPLVVSFYRGMW